MEFWSDGVMKNQHPNIPPIQQSINPMIHQSNNPNFKEKDL
jgi:hypothetical protein